MTYLPAGWPPEVPAPGADGFQRRAVGWLYDHCPPDFRSHEVLRRHPALLARLAREQLAAAVEACRGGYRTVRADLGGELDRDTLDALVAAYEQEGRRLVAAVRAAGLLERALRGETFVRPL